MDENSPGPVSSDSPKSGEIDGEPNEFLIVDNHFKQESYYVQNGKMSECVDCLVCVLCLAQVLILLSICCRCYIYRKRQKFHGKKTFTVFADF